MRQWFPCAIHSNVSSNETVEVRIEVSVAQIVQAALFIVHVTAIAERVPLAQRACQRAGGLKQLAPCIVLVLYNNGAAAVKYGRDIIVDIVSVEVLGTVGRLRVLSIEGGYVQF